MSIVVIGAGAVGLSTALQILTELPQYEVTVIADKFEDQLVSFGAAGIFHPSYVDSYTTDRRRMKRWLGHSYDRFWQLVHSGEAYAAGISKVPMYTFVDLSAQEDWDMMNDYVLNLRALTQRDLAMLNLPKNYKSGHVCDTLVTEGRYLLPYLVEKIRSRGGNFEERTITSANALSKECDLIVNCTGLRSPQLFHDDKVFPVRGQVMRVHAPWIKHVYMGLNDTYVIPTRESVVIGGYRQAGNWNLEVQKHEVTDIFERTTQLEPSLRHASVIKHWVGLRPGRHGIRIELDTESCDIPVVHNYGHNGKGIALSHGTAVEATNIVKKVLHRSKL